MQFKQKAAVSKRQHLRRNLTDVERLIWRHLRARQFAGFKFRRQCAIGPFIVDFYCAEKHIAIELDGGQDFDPEALAYDQRRTQYLAREGVRVLRFTNDLVVTQTQDVLEAIARDLGVET